MRAYRGKRRDNGEWVYGYFCMFGNSAQIFVSFTEEEKEKYKGHFLEKAGGEWHKVIPETVGQDTGLTDKNGKHIFEGDIVNAVYQSGYVGIENTDFGNGIVLYFDSYYGGASYHIDMIGELGYRVFSAGLQDGVTVLGNIFDNPELTEKSC